MCVLIAIRGNRKKSIKINSFKEYNTLFDKALESIERREIFEALTTNGMGVAAANDDDEAIKICNLSIINGAIAAGITGSGPAICIICYEKEVEKLSGIIKRYDMDLIKTTFYSFSGGGNIMGMGLGDKLRITLFGESHGKCVGVLIEGMPPGTEIDNEKLANDIKNRRPGRKGLSTRKELDECEILSGVHEGVATGWPILLITKNSDVKSSDYSFLPDQPRPGHADMVEYIRSGGVNDPRGGGSQSARLTFGIVAAGSQVRNMLENVGWKCEAHLLRVGKISAKQLLELNKESSPERSVNMEKLNCKDKEAAEKMSDYLEEIRMSKDTIGSVVELLIEGLPIGLGEPWFDGLEPSLARGLMAIPGARAVEFSHGVNSSLMRGSEHNDEWINGEEKPTLKNSGKKLVDGALGGRSTGSPMSIKIHFKPPSSIPREQFTLHLPSNEIRSLKVGGRHDPVLGPRAVPVVEAVAMLIIADLGIIGEYIKHN